MGSNKIIDVTQTFGLKELTPGSYPGYIEAIDVVGEYTDKKTGEVLVDTIRVDVLVIGDEYYGRHLQFVIPVANALDYKGDRIAYRKFKEFLAPFEIPTTPRMSAVQDVKLLQGSYVVIDVEALYETASGVHCKQSLKPL